VREAVHTVGRAARRPAFREKSARARDVFHGVHVERALRDKSGSAAEVWHEMQVARAGSSLSTLLARKIRGGGAGATGKSAAAPNSLVIASQGVSS